MLELAARAGLSGRCGRGSARFSGRRIGIYRNDARRLGGRFSADGVRALYSGRIDYPGPACAARREVLASAPRTLLPANDPDEQGSCDHSTHLVRCDAARRRIRFGGTAHWRAAPESKYDPLRLNANAQSRQSESCAEQHHNVPDAYCDRMTLAHPDHSLVIVFAVRLPELLAAQHTPAQGN